MKQEAKYIGGFLFVAGMYFLLRKKPTIKVLSTDAAAKRVTYTMTYKDSSITDTFYIEDQPQFVPAQDGYYFAAFKNGPGIVELAIGLFPGGEGTGFKSIATRLVSFPT